MTLIIGQVFDDSILIVSDMKRVSVDTGEPTHEDIKKVRVIAPRIGIACSGLGLLSDAIVLTLQAIFQGKKEVTLKDMLSCCSSTLHFTYNQFIKTRPEYSDTGISCLIFGIDTETDKPFIFGLSSKKDFIESDCYPNVAIGSGSEMALSVIGKKDFKTHDDATMNFITIIKEVANNISSVGKDTYCVKIDNKSIHQMSFDSDNNLLSQTINSWD